MATISAVSTMGRKHRQAKGRGAGEKGHLEGCATGFTANGFLKHPFLPLYDCGNQLPEKDKAEQGFFQSLSTLSKNGVAVTIDYKSKQYPYNILLAHADLQAQLEDGKDSYELMITSDEADNIFLAGREIYDTGTSFYFIPVIPLCRLLKKKQHKQSAELLLSIFAYLYHVAGIPYYRDNDSALSYYYEMTEEWLRDDLESYDLVDQYRNLSDINTANYYGDLMHRKIFNSVHLNKMQDRIGNFSARSNFDLECLELAQAFHRLCQQFPNAGVFDNIPDLEQDLGFDEQAVRAQQYISFIADNEGWLYESIADALNNEFNECTEMEQHAITEIFTDEAKDDCKNLDFEKQLFPLITDLCSLLNEIR